MLRQKWLVASMWRHHGPNRIPSGAQGVRGWHLAGSAVAWHRARARRLMDGTVEPA
jgi:hypothetical protein